MLGIRACHEAYYTWVRGGTQDVSWSLLYWSLRRDLGPDMEPTILVSQEGLGACHGAYYTGVSGGTWGLSWSLQYWSLTRDLGPVMEPTILESQEGLGACHGAIYLMSGIVQAVQCLIKIATHWVYVPGLPTYSKWKPVCENVEINFKNFHLWCKSKAFFLFLIIIILMTLHIYYITFFLF